MKTFAFFAALVFATALSAKSDKGAQTADELWAEISSREAPPATSDAKGSAASARNAKTVRQADRLRGKAALAKAFYTQFPDHPKAGEARKVEAISEIRSVTVGDSSQENAAFAIGKAFRADKTNSLVDRFEVALATDRLVLSSKIKAKQAENRSDEWLQVADNLRTEFGSLPELDRYYLEIARGANLETSRSIATALVARDSAPSVKAQAQAILDRHASLGKPVKLTVTTVDGLAIDLANGVAPGLVVVVWSPTDTEGANAVGRFRDALAGRPCLFLALDATPDEARNFADSLPGVRAYVAPGAASRTVRETLKLDRRPYVYVIDAHGCLAAFGPVAELPALVAGITATAN